MGAQNLGPRKMRAISRAIGLKVVHAVVWSHCESGRAARFTVEGGRRGWFDRRTGEWELDPGGGE